MRLKNLFCLLFACCACAAGAEAVSFPGCAWSETKVLTDGGRVRVVDAAGRPILNFTTEGGNYADHLVVYTRPDHLAIDARSAFAAGMRKLVFTSANFDVKPLLGRSATLVSDFGGARGAKLLAYFEGHAPNLHYYKYRKLETKGHRKSYPHVAEVPEQLDSLHLRWDVTEAAKTGPVAFYGAKYGLEADLPQADTRPAVSPELIFHAPFDGTVEAKTARGIASPARAEGLEFAEGRRGQAVRLTRKAKSVLQYVAKGNLVPERGTVSLWFKREWPDRGGADNGGEVWRSLFSNEPAEGERVGSGQLWFWFWGRRFRADVSDDDDSHVVWNGAEPLDDWNHLAVCWDETGVKPYLNGRPARGLSDGASPMIAALKPVDLLSFSRQAFGSFFVGGQGASQQFDGLVDDLRIYSAPLSDGQVRELWRRERLVELRATGRYALADTPSPLHVSATSPAGCDLAGLRYCIRDKAGKVVARYDEKVGDKTATLLVNLPKGAYELCATDGTWYYGAVSLDVLRADNPYELTGDAARRAEKAPGVPAHVELVETLTLGRAPDANRFRSVGSVATRTLGGVPYLEAGPKAGDRFALRFDLKRAGGLWMFEIDYPDDALRTADLIIQKSRKSGGDYTMQVGYAAGDEYPNTGRILTHRVLYWSSDPDVTLVAMTARAGAPAAVAAVRVYRVTDDALPAADVREPQPPPPPSGFARMIADWKNFDPEKLKENQARVSKEAQEKGWGRLFGLYFEDPAVGYDFALPKSDGFLPEELDDLVDRTAALMKFTGQNLLAYPGAWYHGLIGEDYNPRHHAPDFLSAWYAKFDREGLYLMPTVNPNTMPVPDGLVTRRSMSDGTLHDSVVAIHDTGKPNWGGWHDTPPNFNFQHPQVQRHVAGILDALVEQGASHPSFKGVCLHLTRHCLLWFGDAESGYNDYTVKAFAKAKGLQLPKEFEGRALRGKDYADWLRAHAWNDWIQWRCDVVTAFYAKQARKLAARRPDLKLWLNYMVPANFRHPDFLKPEFMEQACREAGLDRVRLGKEIPNLVLGLTMVPADYRWRQPGEFPSPAARDKQRVLDEQPEFYALLKGASFPLVHQHDRYWESPIGAVAKSADSLSCDWLKECAWRVSTINPSGVHALRHFVEPFRHGDVLGLTKGGFLIGTYGMEPRLVPFARAFRALPAVVMEDVETGHPAVRVRACTFQGKSWFYVVNTDFRPASILLGMPKDAADLVSGETYGSALFGGDGTVRLDLGPYDFRSFSAPEGRPVVKGSAR